MAVAKITKQMVEYPDLPDKGHRVVWDSRSGYGGFGIRVSFTGRVSFVVRYWTGERERWKTLGAYPRLSLTDARREAQKYLRAAGDGVDPVHEERKQDSARREARGKKLETLAAQWLAELPNKVTRRGRRISPRSVELYESCMNNYIVPHFGDRPVSEVTRADVRDLHRHATTAGGPYAANRVVNVLSIFYNWLADTEALPEGVANPARRPPRNPELSRGEFADVRLTPDQEARLVRSIYRLIDGTMELEDKRGTVRNHSDPVGGVALLTLLDTGRRKEEVLRMQWRRLDLDGGTANLGATKGKRAGDTCYLTSRVCEAIRKLPRIVGNPYVFVGRGKGGRRSDLQSAWELVKRDADLEQISPDLAGFHLHDLRHHRISELLAAGVAPQLVIQQVGHTSYDQLKVYGHVQVADVAKVLGTLKPVEPAQEPDAKVVPMRRAERSRV